MRSNDNPIYSQYIFVTIEKYEKHEQNQTENMQHTNKSFC